MKRGTTPLSCVVHVFHQRYDPSTGARRDEYVSYDYEGTTYDGVVTKNTPAGFDQRMWVEAREKIFNTLGVRGTKRTVRDNLCYDRDLGRSGVALSFIFFDIDKRLEDMRRRFKDEELIAWQTRMAPYSQEEFLQQGQQLYDGFYFRDIMMYVTEKERPEKVIGHILIADKYGYTNYGGKYYLDLFCSKGCGNALMKVYKAHCNDRPTILYSNMKVMYFYNRHGFKIGKECSQDFPFDIKKLNQQGLVKGMFSDAQHELGSLCIDNRLGLLDEIDVGKKSCYEKCSLYAGASTAKERAVIYKQYADKLCFENVAMVYCPRSSPKKKSPTLKRGGPGVYKRTRTRLCRSRS